MSKSGTSKEAPSHDGMKKDSMSRDGMSNGSMPKDSMSKNSKSKDSMSNGGLLLLDDYLVSPYGFTSERRFVYVLDAHSGHVVQKLPVVENVCPSKSWAPHWHSGERCDVVRPRTCSIDEDRCREAFTLIGPDGPESVGIFEPSDARARPQLAATCPKLT